MLRPQRETLYTQVTSHKTYHTYFSWSAVFALNCAPEHAMTSRVGRMTDTQSATVSTQPRPQDDFFRSVNGAWIDSYVLPDDKSSYGSFSKLVDDSEKAIRDILTDPHTTATRSKIIFDTFMDTETISQASYHPLDTVFAELDDATSKADLTRVLGSLNPEGGPDLFSLFVSADAGDPTTAIAYIGQGGIGLPDEAYYREKRYEPIRQAYVTLISRLLQLSHRATDEKDATVKAQRVLDLETKIAACHWDNVTDRDDSKTYNKETWKQLAARLSHFDLEAWALAWQKAYDDTAAHLDQPIDLKQALSTVIVREPDFFDGLDGVWNKADLDDLRLWAISHVLMANAAFLSDDFVQASFDFNGRVLSGTKKIRDRWKRGVSLVNSVCGEDVGKEYVQHYFPASSKKKMEKLVSNLIAAYRVSITNSGWLGEQTKKKALAKLDKFTPMIGYTRHWRDYSALHVSRDHSIVDNMRAASVYANAHELSKAGKPVDKEEWLMNPQEVNAYYEQDMNVIVFPAAILQPPFFDPNADDATNFGGIGAVIGHEIGHGFDDQGSKYDGDGKLHDWWTAEDRSNFEKLTHALIDQYNTFVPLNLQKAYAEKGKADEAPHVNGALTIGENIGDLSGVNIALKAYVISEGKKADTQKDLEESLASSPVIDGKSAAQRFFLNYALIWREVRRNELAEQYLAIDPHSPAEFRTNGIVRNVDAFYSAFDVKPGDKMWLDPDKRVRIW